MSNTIIQTLKLQKLNESGELQYTYLPLQNYVKDNSIGNFITSDLLHELKPISLDVLKDYDGSVNLLLNNDYIRPTIINSRFAVLENNKYTFITRNQKQATNLYNDSTFSQESNLFLIPNSWPNIELVDVINGGQLWGGNYTFYIKYTDEDNNETSIVSESGSVAIFNGNTPYDIQGLLLDERSNKSINLKIHNLDLGYSKYNIYFSRNTSDLNGTAVTKFYKINQSFNTKDDNIIISGYEDIVEINPEELNIVYNYYSTAKTQAVVQNMLFLGNVGSEKYDTQKIKHLSTNIKVKCTQNINIGYVNNDYSLNRNYTLFNQEYYSPNNIYNYVGYWPNEYYRLGIVYMMNNGETSEVYNLRGCIFNNINEYNFDEPIDRYEEDAILDDGTNTFGVFKTPDVKIYDHNNYKTLPLGLEFTISAETLNELKKLGVVGYFFCRQNRIPTIIAQGLSVGVDTHNHIPMLYVASKSGYVTESFVGSDGFLNSDYSKKQRFVGDAGGSGLLCLDANVNSRIQSLLTNSEFELIQDYSCRITEDGRMYQCNKYTPSQSSILSKLIYVPSETPVRFINGTAFSTKVGNAEGGYSFGTLYGNRDVVDTDVIRGNYVPFIGSDAKIDRSSIYSIKLKVPSDEVKIKQLGNLNAEFNAISNRYKIPQNITDVTISNIYRGDCFTNTVTLRMNYNFIDPNVPLNDKVVTNKTWSEMVNASYYSEVNWNDVNIADLNASQLGTWITYKCLSNYNLGLRANNTQDTTIMNKLGTYRSFYPISSTSTKSNNKAEESWLLNEGYSRIIPRKQYVYNKTVPFVNKEFSNRIAFSNIDSTKMFNSGFRVFQGLSYQDIDNSFGAIIKLLPYGQNLFCVFEHGCAVVPVNEKALLSTQEGQSIHLYGAGVLQEQVSVISPDFGSIWQDSIIKTPDAYYGVDTYAKKIWKFNNEGFQIISDQKINSFLNDNINLSEQDKYPVIAYSNVKTHYNNYKGDVMFTFYHKDKCWNLCYNERMKVWTTQYSWTPLISTNVDNIYYSIDRDNYKNISQVYSQNPVFNYFTNSKPFNYILNGSGWTDLIYSYNTNIIDYDIKLSKLHDEYPYKIMKLKVSVWRDATYIIYDINDPELEWLTQNNYTVWLDIKKNIHYVNINGHLYKYNQNELESNSEIDTEGAPVEYSEIAFYYTIQQIKYENTHVTLPIIYTKAINKYPINNKNEGRLSIKTTASFEHVNIGEIQLTALKNGLNIVTDTLFYAHNELDINTSIYKHGQSGIIDNVNTISPTKWYDTQHPFEFEFVVNKPVGLHKIFDNLVIISNNVQPKSLEIEIEGDVYDFIKSDILDRPQTEFKKITIQPKVDKTFIYNTEVVYDRITNQPKLKIQQDCINMKEYGRRLGNIQYLEDSWRLVVQPIYYTEGIKTKSTKVRDKYAKIRIKYSGEDLVTINAIHTLMTSSYV